MKSGEIPVLSRNGHSPIPFPTFIFFSGSRQANRISCLAETPGIFFRMEDLVFTRIKKRDGQVVSFDAAKISRAIFNAGRATGEFGKSESEYLKDKVIDDARKIIKEPIITVEQIQDIVEEVLLNSRYKETAKAYILYRDQHKKLREIANKMNNGLVEDYLTKSDWLVNENSNMAFSLQGLNYYVSSEVTKNYWLNMVYPEKIRQAHLRGDFHIHDLNLLSVYCVGWDLFDLITVGFTGVEGKISSRPPKHFRTALGQIVNFFYTLQGEAAGAQAFSNFDTLLAPFIRYDNLSYFEVKQALQEFIYNINIPTRVGFQTPFTNITLDLTVPSYYADQAVIIGGQPCSATYKDFQDEMDIFNQVFLDVMTEGDAKGRVFTFPIPTYSITKDFDWERDSIHQLWEATAKYGLPYFSNFINSDMDPEDARSMCCRLRIDNRMLRKRGGGLFGSNPLTGSVGVVTINLARIGYTQKTKKDFLDRLYELMLLAKDSLIIKRKTLEKYTEANLYPYTKFYLRNIKAQYGAYWKNHFSTIGINGMNEALMNLFGENIASQKGRQFAEEVLDFMREKLILFQEETGDYFNLEATPAEGTSYRLALLDKKYLENSYFANGKGKQVEDPFYTNSTHLPVNFSEDIFEVLDLQDSLQMKYTGGTVLHFFLGERIEDPMIVKKLVRKICESYHLPYFTLTPTFSICPNHGYLVGEVPVCDRCGEECEIYSRVVGYLRPVKQWNNGKKAEFAMRKTYQV